MAVFAIAPTSARSTTRPPAPPMPERDRQTYDAQNSSAPAGGLGKLIRSEGQGPSGDADIDAAHDNAGHVHDFFKQVLGRDSWDGKGAAIKSVVHFGHQFNNAGWDGTKMIYGDGDGKVLSPTSHALDVVGHEIAHAVTERTAGLIYRNQSGALNESFSDVFGEVIEQWTENRAGFGTVDAAKAAEWLIGEDVFTPTVSGDSLRSMRAPGTGHANDPQPDHMSRYNPTTQDEGGVHINSGIPNKAAYEVAIRLGSEKLAKVWYLALTDYLRPNSSFVDAAAATLSAAKKLYGSGAESQAVADAWKSVGIVSGAQKIALRMPGSTADRGTAGASERPVGILPFWLQDGRVDAAELAILG